MEKVNKKDTDNRPVFISAQQERNYRVRQLKEEHTKRRALASMKDQVEVMMIDSEYLAVDSYQRERIKGKLEQLFDELNR